MFCFSDDHQPTFVYPSLEEENLHPPYVVDVDSIYSLDPAHKDELCIQILFEFDQPCNLEDIETDSKPSQISAHYAIISEPCHQLVNPHVQHTTFQAKIRNRLLKALKLPYYLNSYPLDFFGYPPRLTGEDHVTAEKHLGAFENFVDNFEILHGDVVMSLFSKSLGGDVTF